MRKDISKEKNSLMLRSEEITIFKGEFVSLLNVHAHILAKRLVVRNQKHPAGADKETPPRGVVEQFSGAWAAGSEARGSSAGCRQPGPTGTEGRDPEALGLGASSAGPAAGSPDPHGVREVSCTANGLLFDIYCLLVWSQLWWMRKVGDSKMFERIKRSDEASASSAQGIQRHGVEGSPRQDSSSSLHRRGQEHPRPGASAGQNRQGYCNCCHVHYSNLEQHVFSSQHRHFTTYCRNRMGTSSLMERFLQDVLQHHPHRYHDSSKFGSIEVELAQ
ncbi:PREDICTED: uncharacterized protein LOC107603323 [Ficedula albicollis]|uniref:uncharacterized protein LOC107603323 n=1 Tax=Ficedula albicollis TaxID=59894 RepID=UPI0007AD84D4|nr:PREDICTED: uncharacterized protein LOC107603323 [Ficedula albicollis]